MSIAMITVPPTIYPACERIIVIGDVHGDMGRLMDILYNTKVINPNGEWIADPPNTMVVQLGDQIDSASRGGDPSWERLPDTEVMLYMDRLDDVARMKGGRVLSLIGNHEFMNVLGDFTYVSPKSLSASGSTEMRRRRFQPGGPYAHILAKRNVVLKIGSNLFCHGGLLPEHLDAVDNQLIRINEVAHKVLKQEVITQQQAHILHNIILGDNGILWTRSYLQNVEEDLLDLKLQNVLERTQSKHIYVGHNTVSNISPAHRGKLWFVDAQLSRAYGSPGFQALEIINDGAEFRLLKSAPAST